MATIVTRVGKGSPLTFSELDSNFTNLNTDKLERNGSIAMTGNLNLNSNSITNVANFTASGTVTGGTFSGSGASLTSLNGSQITTGTIPVARLNGGTTGQFVRGDGTYSNAILGDVGIGTVGPVGRFAVAGSGGIQVVIDSDANRGWVQSYGSRPLQLNPIGNDIAMCLAGGSVGIATSNVGSYGLSLSQSANLSWDQSATESIATIFRQANSAALVLASGYKRSSTTNGFASSFASSWAKTAISVGGIGSGVISFYVDAAAAVSVGTDITPTERMRIASTGTTIYAPSSGTALTANSVSGGISLQTTDGIANFTVSHGGGTTNVGAYSNNSLNLVANSVTRINIASAGNVTINAPASGDHTVEHSVGGAQAIGYRGIPRSTTVTTLALADRGKCIAVTAGITVPNSTFAAGDAVSIYNDSAAAITITAGVTTLRQAGTTNTGNRTLAPRGMATIWFNSATEAIISGPGVS